MISLLIKSYNRSLPAKILRISENKLLEIIKGSKSYELVSALGEVLSNAKDSSLTIKTLKRICLPFIRLLTAKREGKVKRKGGGVINRVFKIILSPWALPIGFLLFFWSSLAKVSSTTLLLIYSVVAVMAISIYLASKEGDLEVIDSRGVILFLGSLMFLIGYAAFIAQLSKVGGIPLLNDQLRRGLSPILNYIAWTTVPGTAFLLSSMNLDNCEAYALALVGFIPSFFLAFRTEMIAYILATLVVLYFRKMISGLHISLGLVITAVFFVGVGAIRSITTGLVQNPIFSVLYRPTITIAALDTIVRLYDLMPVTDGRVHLAAFSSLGLIRGSRYGPRTIISIYTGGRRTVSTTATLIGGPLLDWGWIGAVTVPFLLAYLLSFSYKFSMEGKHLLGPYATLYSYSLVGIETGILDINVYAYITIALLLIILSLRPKNEIET